MARHANKARTIIIASILLGILAIFTADLVKIQLIDGDEYVAASKRVNIYSLKAEPARGEILDRNGNALVVNRQGNSIIFDASYFPSTRNQAQRNELIIHLINLLESRDEEWIDPLPLFFDEDGNIAFAENREADIEYLKSSELLNLNRYATPENCLDALIERFSLDSYSNVDARKIASVCVELRRNAFSINNPYTFAEDVSTATIAAIKEQSEVFKGVDLNVVSYREYVEHSLASHLLGTVGAIDSDEYNFEKNKLDLLLEDESLADEEIERLKRSAYALNDSIGKSGIEKAMEEYLRGLQGTKVITRDANGQIETEYTKLPVQGNTVILTIDSGIQRTAEVALEKRIKELTTEKGLEAAGAVVVIDVNTGEILASASYPTFDLSTYYEQYSDLAADPASPLWNRALQSAYAPGSTMKPVVAIAALETNTITKDTKYTCQGIISYKDMTFSCLKSHGSVNAVEAIDVSCNIFFYNTADILGITKMNEYSTRFGLGMKTGIELPEATGILAGVSHRDSLGRVWLPGDTLQAAIGQSDNLFTPIQLANYCATIANGGTRYVPHIIKSIKSADYSESIIEKEPEIALETGVSKSSLDIVREGMHRVGTIGFTKNVFANLPVEIAAKTGTSQTVKIVDGKTVKGNNGFVISYGPYEKPEIAVAVLIENVDSGTATATVAADIYDYYFNTMGKIIPPQEINRLLS